MYSAEEGNINILIFRLTHKVQRDVCITQQKDKICYKNEDKIDFKKTYDCPDMIISDNGAEFTLETVRNLDPFDMYVLICM